MVSHSFTVTGFILDTFTKMLEISKINIDRIKKTNLNSYNILYSTPRKKQLQYQIHKNTANITFIFTDEKVRRKKNLGKKNDCRL